MSAKAIYETDGKSLVAKCLQNSCYVKNQFAVVVQETNWDDLVKDNPWISSQKLVVKPDQLIKRRGKLGLIKVNVNSQEAKKWIEERLGIDIQVGAASGPLKRFIIEPFVPHEQNEEFYVCIYAQRNCDTILFHHEGGVEVGDVDSKAVKLELGLEDKITIDWLRKNSCRMFQNKRKNCLPHLFMTCINFILIYTSLTWK